MTKAYYWVDKMNKCNDLDELAWVWMDFLKDDYYKLDWKTIAIIEEAYWNLKILFKSKGFKYSMARKPKFYKGV